MVSWRIPIGSALVEYDDRGLPELGGGGRQHGETAPGSANATMTTFRVEVLDGEFRPASLAVSTGDAITFSRATSARDHHVVAFRKGAFRDSHPLTPSHGAHTVRFSTPGTFAFYCSVYPEMQGSVCVERVVPAPVVSPPALVVDSDADDAPTRVDNLASPALDRSMYSESEGDDLPSALESDQGSEGDGGDHRDGVDQHPLLRRWTLWHDRPLQHKPKTWLDGVSRVYTFATAEDFWRIHNNVIEPSNLAAKSNYHLFPDGVDPMWEDPSNVDGGKWVIELQRDRPTASAEFNEFWLLSALAMIGESFEYAHEVCGIVASARRKEHKVSIWTKTASDKEACMSIGRSIKDLLKFPGKMGYQTHNDALNTHSGFRNRNLYQC